MNELTVTYYGHPFDVSGYGEACRATIHALDRAGVQLSLVDLSGHAKRGTDPFLGTLLNRRVPPDFHLFHGIPPDWAGRGFPLRNVIAMTVWETNKMPSQWRNILNHAIDVWLPCQFNRQVFDGALEKPTFVLPHPLPQNFPPPQGGNSCPLNGLTSGKFVFYSVFEWQDRKNPKGILEAYLRAFSDNDPTLLVLKTNASAACAAQATLADARGRLQSGASVEIRAEEWTHAQINALHDLGDCYVSLHRGEGWNYPLFEAAARGTPVVSTAFSGPLDYLDPAAHRFVRWNPAPVLQPYRFYHRSMQWAEPDPTHAAEQLRWVFEYRDSARCSAAAAALTLRERFSPESVGQSAVNRMLALLQRTQPDRWQEIARSRQPASLEPSLPIPPEWFDRNYFETGRKSNWERGYNWTNFGSLFKETAEFLAEMFPEADSFLDAGCSMGFLVRALRENGKAAWGVDASHYALAHSDVSVRQFIEQHRVEEHSPSRRYSMLLAFSILESLTPAQIQQFLTRARAFTDHAIFAVINCSEDPERPGTRSRSDRDLSHVTMRSRAWWHDQFVQAGWRQDLMCRHVQRLCQRHSLATRMGWETFLYAS
jgi:glycosyltransferase involved in cell wall biosynthesis